MFIEFLTQNEFYEKYMTLFTTRFSISNMELEDTNTNIISPNRAIEFYNNMNAFKNIIQKNPAKISPYDLTDIAYIVNNAAFTKGFRKTQVQVKAAKNFTPLAPRYIPNAIYSLFDTYHNIWTNLDIYEKEARLHIELVRIQPFEDGNKRTARILTNYNLCKQNKAPIIINEDETKEYFRCIDEYDIKALTLLFQKKSQEELSVMINLYITICGNSIAPSSNSTDNDINILALNK